MLRVLRVDHSTHSTLSYGSSMVTPTDDEFDHECIVDRCSGIAYCRTYCVCDSHKTQVTRYLQVCHKLNIPLPVVKYEAPHSNAFRSDLMDTVEIVFAAMLFDTWATSAEDMEILILMKGM